VHFDIIGKDYTARAETRSGFFHLCSVDCKSGIVLPKIVRRFLGKFDSSRRSCAQALVADTLRLS
jgi:hypothetical protein